jgi:hypothetical protein
MDVEEGEINEVRLGVGRLLGGVDGRGCLGNLEAL